MLSRLTWEYLRGHRTIAATIIVLQIVQSLVSLTLPRLTADIIDKGVVVGDIGYILSVGGLMVGMTAIQGVCLAIAVYLASRLAMAYAQYLRARIFKKVINFGVTEIHSFGPASLITRATNDIRQIQTLTYTMFTVLVMTPIIGVGGIFMAIHEDAKLSLLLTVIVPVLAGFLALLLIRLSPMFSRLQQRLDAAGQVMREQLSGVRVIRAFNRQPEEKQRFEKANDAIRNQALSISYTFATLFPVISALTGLAFAAVLWFGGGRIDVGSMTIGALIAYVNYLMQIMIAVTMAGMMFIIVPRARVSADRIGAVLDTDPSIGDPSTPVAIPAGPLAFRLDDVSLTFGEAELPVLDHINLTLEPGTVTALIGPTGAGKTILTNLLPRLADPTGGRITVSPVTGLAASSGDNAIDLRDVTLDELRSRIALVPQTAHLFRGTIATNVATLSPTDITTEVRQRVQHCLEITDAWEFVSQLKDGVDAHVGAGGSGYSGGQRQRLTIARAVYQALYGQAQLLVIDDSFSALDLATDARVRARLQKALQDISILIVAQRLSTIRDANQIAVMEQGRIVGLGTHTDLLQSCDAYAQIAASQEVGEAA